jgi:F-type H+-transporting ATPase subunit c
MKMMRIVFFVVLLGFIWSTPAWAFVTKNVDKDGKSVEAGGPDHVILSGAAVGAGVGAAITIIGAGYGFGRIGSAALESMARQPEVAGRVQTAMIVIAALLEGATFFALLVCIQLVNRATF